MADPRHTYGRSGEELAAQYLQQHGMTILARRYTTPVGELDLVARAQHAIVFVEVKTRRDRRYADPQDAITPAKQRRLAKAAAWFLHEKRLDDRPCRFDVVTIIGGQPAETPPEIEHIPDFFLPER